MKVEGVTKGLLAGKFPYARLGHAPRKLVIFPGLADSIWDVTSRASALPYHYAKFANEFTVYLISRKRGLPHGCTTADMAADYAEVFEREIGPASVLGISLGGHIAQHFAANYPQYVQQLVIACSAFQVSLEGRAIPERWLSLANQHRWHTFFLDVARITCHEYRHALSQFIHPWSHMNFAHPRDFLYSLEASLNHDGSNLLNRIQSPTLIIGGSADIFFPPTRLRETARRIAHATLHLIEGGHAAYELRRDEFDTVVLDFLLGRSPQPIPSIANVPLVQSAPLVSG